MGTTFAAILAGLSAMGLVDSILRPIIVGAAVRSHEFLGQRRARSSTGAAHDLRTWPTTGSDSGSGLGLRLLNVRDAANEVVSSSVNSATGTTSGVTVSSSRSAGVSADAVSGGARARSASFQVKITNLAVAQVNEGGELASSDTNAVQAGTNRFTIKVGTGTATTVSFANDSTDTYAEALENLATAINDADTGTTASVVEDEDGGTVQLVLTADATGLGNSFTVADVNGNVVSTVGFGSSTTVAENAEFFVNGVPKTSDSNTVLIDKGRVRLTLKAETGPTGDDDEPGAVISVKPDPLADGVVKLTSALNGFRSFVQNQGSAFARNIRDTFDQLLASAKTDLGSLGVSILENSQLSVDRERLEAAIVNSRSTVSTLLASSGGLAARLSAVAGAAREGSRVRAQHGELVGSDELSSGGALATTYRGSSRGVLVDVFG